MFEKSYLVKDAKIKVSQITIVDNFIHYAYHFYLIEFVNMLDI